ncbi:MAG: deoxyguanosinetriphosphate triphosphohydrolase [Armatimonadetes bacterium]|nr:deoxyguanosinetriphosphate triphosphohydrolase [Armatimonadota bacterium]
MPTPREHTERIERETLSPHAAKSADSRGRVRPEPPCPIRTDFQRDRDRVIHSKAFRRLAHKTQVFIAPEADHYRTRLTHTLEVSQIARTIARALRLNEDLTEAIALAHDLGHTPFGHAGEAALDAAYREFDPEARFHHAEQSLRVVEVIEKDGQGLNLTHEVRDGVRWHSKGMEDLPRPGNDRPGTLEGMVVLYADRIAYINHDIDDALRAGLIERSDLPPDAISVLGDTHSRRITTMVSDIVSESAERAEIRAGGQVTAATNRLKDFLHERVYRAAAQRAGESERVGRILHQLFRFYMEHPEALFGTRADTTATRARLARRVCDHLAGMTDRFAVEQFATHFVPQGWRSLD